MPRSEILLPKKQDKIGKDEDGRKLTSLKQVFKESDIIEPTPNYQQTF